MMPRAFHSLSPRAALLALALAAAPLAAQSPANAVRVSGSILDSLTNSPLAAASVHFLRADDLGSESIGARTDAAGKFEISLAPGRWLVGIEHPRFDSLAIALPARRIEIPAKPTFRLALATASAHTLTQAFCGKDAREDDVVVVGVVQNAGSGVPLDSADVLVQWSTVRIALGSGAKVIASTAAAHTDRNGWYVLCGSPHRAQIVAWAERGATATGLIEAQTSDVPMRLDLWLDPSATKAANESDTAAATHSSLDATRKRPAVRAGDAHIRALVTDASGKPIPGARARVIGHRVALGDESGMVSLDSLPGGSQTLEVRALGFVPLMREVHLSASSAAQDTVVLTSVKSLLDTVRINAGRVYSVDATGFDHRKKTGVGSYITAEEIERLHPASLASLLQARSAINIEDTKYGDQMIRMAAPWGGTCTPTIFVDGEMVVHPNGPPAGALMADASGGSAAATQGNTLGSGALTPSTPEPAGLAEVSWLVSPTEIVGVEIYRRPMEIPAVFQTGGYMGCGAIVIWTHFRAATPEKSPPGDTRY
jgi:hypothetical protein